MIFQTNIFAILLLAASITLVAFAFFIISKKNETLNYFSLTLFANAVWSFAYGLELMSTKLGQMLFFIRIEYIGICLAPYFWIVFCLSYTHQLYKFKRIHKAFFLIFPLITYILIFFQEELPYHYKETSVDTKYEFPLLSFKPGLWYFIHTGYFYVIFLLGVYYLLRDLLKKKHVYRYQYMIMLFACVFPWFVNLAYIFGFKINDHIDPTPFAFFVTAILISSSLLLYRNYEILPISKYTLYDNINDGIIIVDTENRIIDYNKFIYNNFNPAKNQKGKKIEDVFKKIDGSDLIEINNISLKISKEPIEKHNHLIGNYYYLKDVSNEIKTTNKLLETEQLFRKLSEKVPGMLYQFEYSVDKQFTFPFSGKGIEEIYEISIEEAKKDGLKVLGRIHQEDRERVYKSVIISGEQLTPWECTYRVILPKKGLRWLQGRAIPEKRLNGNILWHGYINDITELKLVEQELTENAEKLKQLNNEKLQLLSLVSHDLRNPLYALKSLIGLLNENFISEAEFREQLIQFGINFNQTISMIENLLIWSKNQMTDFEIQHINIELAKFLKEKMIWFELLLIEKKLKIDIDCEPDLQIISDPILLTHIIQNLLSNAIKFSPQNTAIKLFAKSIENKIHIGVIDTGEGISDEKIKMITENKIFTSNGTNNEKGNGLGLVIVKNLLKKLNSDLKIERIKAGGSEFYFELEKLKEVPGRGFEPLRP